MDRYFESITGGMSASAPSEPRRAGRSTLGALQHLLTDGPYQIRNLHVAGRRTTVRLELPFWRALDDLCEREGRTLDELATTLDELRGEQGLTGMLRCYILTYWRQQAA